MNYRYTTYSMKSYVSLGLFFILFLVSCADNSTAHEDSRVYGNYRNCEETTPSIVAVINKNEINEYLDIYAYDNGIGTNNLDTYWSILPGDELVVLEDTIKNDNILKVQHSKRGNSGRLIKVQECYIWKGFVVSSKDSVAECWKGYSTQSLFF